ncbi:MAG: electron transfer flavoprotein subunit beta/FixA family protein [candidate division WOR-3 bacterium]
MEIAVCIKRVPDTAEADVRIDSSGRDIVRERLAYTINEADNYALEEALLWRERYGAGVTLVSFGSKEAEEVLRMGLAKGATAAVRLDDAGMEGLDGLALARVLAGFFSGRRFDVIMTGCVATDDGNSQTGPALAALLGLPHATYVVRSEFSGDKVVVRRELEGGLLEVKEIPLPCVLSFQTGGNSPRYASILGIKRAAARPIEQLPATRVGEQKTELVRLYLPEVVASAQILAGSLEEKTQVLAELLKTKGVVR